MLRTALVGWPRVGKTTLFGLLTGLSPGKSTGRPGRFSHQVGIAAVPDQRLQVLSELVKPKKTTWAQIEFVDLAGIGKGDAKDSTYLAQLRDVDALAHVVRAFQDPAVHHIEGDVNPLRDVQVFELELILADLALLEGRLERIGKERKKVKRAELEKEFDLVERMCHWLEGERPLREFEFTADEEKMTRGFMLLSQKPMLIVLNLDEKQTREHAKALALHGLETFIQRPKMSSVAVCAKIESEIAELEPADAEVFLRDIGFSEPGLNRLLTGMYSLLDLISFLTVGEPEVRAWPIPRGSTAQSAAGTIHSDFEKGFIRAEVIDWQRLLTCGSFSAAREKGELRSEGKDYVVHDGDVMLFRFNL